MGESSLILEQERKEMVLALLADGKEVKLKMQGTSMFPSIKPGEFAVIKPIDFTTLRVGQVIVFQEGSRWVAHRLLEIQNEHFIAQGDSLITADLPIEKTQLIGVVNSVNSKTTYAKLRPIPQLLNRSMLRAKRLLQKLGFG